MHAHDKDRSLPYYVDSLPQYGKQHNTHPLVVHHRLRLGQVHVRPQQEVKLQIVIEVRRESVCEIRV